MEQEQIAYLDDEYKEKVRSFCTNLIDVGINEFLNTFEEEIEPVDVRKKEKERIKWLYSTLR